MFDGSWRRNCNGAGPVSHLYSHVGVELWRCVPQSLQPIRKKQAEWKLVTGSWVRYPWNTRQTVRKTTLVIHLKIILTIRLVIISIKGKSQNVCFDQFYWQCYSVKQVKETVSLWSRETQNPQVTVGLNLARSADWLYESFLVLSGN